MQINFINQNINFKKIELSAEEKKIAQSRFRSITLNPQNTTKAEEFFDVFEPHLNKEVELKKTSTPNERRDFANNFYLKYIELLEAIKSKKITFAKFIEELNIFSDN